MDDTWSPRAGKMLHVNGQAAIQCARAHVDMHSEPILDIDKVGASCVEYLFTDYILVLVGIVKIC